MDEAQCASKIAGATSVAAFALALRTTPGFAGAGGRRIDAGRRDTALCVEIAHYLTEIDLLEIIPGRGLHIRTRQESG